MEIPRETLAKAVQLGVASRYFNNSEGCICTKRFLVALCLRSSPSVFMWSGLTKKSSVSVSGCSVKTQYSDRSTLRVTPTRNSGPIPGIPREESWPAQTRQLDTRVGLEA